MAISDYLRNVRERVGHDLLVLPSAAVAVLDDQGRLLLGEHSDRNLWVMPGGLIEPGESPADAAVRETFEETGLIVQLRGVVGVFGGPNLVVHYNNGDKASYVATVFRGSPIGGRLHPDGVEILEVGYFFQEELSSLPHPKWMDEVISWVFSSEREPYFQPPTWQP